MGLSLLAPLFLVGLAALAVPVLVHLTDRERRNVVRFPSLRFLTRLPFRRTKRQRIRHPLLFALRVLALVLLVLAFSRPFVEGSAAVAGDGRSGDAVIALDRSYSMGFGDNWSRALRRTRETLDALPAGTRVSLVSFDETAELAVSPTTDRASVVRALDELAPGSGGTRFAPALRLANEVLLESAAVEREVVLVSDFQTRGWDRSDRTRLVAGASLTAVDLSAGDPANVMVAGAEARPAEARPAEGDDGPAFTLTARLLNRGPEAIGDLSVKVEAEGRELADGRVSLPASGGTAVRLGPIALPPAGSAGSGGVPRTHGVARITVRTAGDRLAADDVFYLTLSDRPAVPVLLVEARDARPGGTLYLRQALAIAEEPAFEVFPKAADELTAEDVESAALVILHDCPAPSGAAGQALGDLVAGGGGLWLLGGRSASAFPEELHGLLPGRWQETVDRLDAQGVSLAGVDYDHPVFEIFSGAGDGNVSAPRYFRYRVLALEEAGAHVLGAHVLARYTDGAVALAEWRHGEGRVLAAGAPLDNRWSNLPVQPVFVPFVHQVSQYLSGEKAGRAWRAVGDVLDAREVLAEAGAEITGSVAVEAPSGRRTTLDLESAEPFLRLDEAGFYEIHDPGEAEGTHPVAVNVNRSECDLTRLDVEAFVAASTSEAAAGAPAAPGARRLTREERERRQGIWWYLVLGALLLLAAESILSNRWSGVSPA